MTIDPISIAGEIIKDVAAPTASLSEVWSALIGDRVAYWRLKNAMKYRPLINEEAKRLGLVLSNKIPDRYSVAWFEEASKQDEPEIQILFARLLARAADFNAKDEPDRRLIDLLSRLTPRDATLFQLLYCSQPFPDTGIYSETHGIGDEREKGWPEDWARSLIQHALPDFQLTSLENLLVVGLIGRTLRLDFSNSGGAMATKTPEHIAWGKEISSRIKQRPYLEATELGRALHAAIKE